MNKQGQVGEADQRASEQLLLAQLAEMSSDWRHLDTRVERAISFYISVFTLVLSIIGGIATFYRPNRAVTDLLNIGAVLSPFLIVLGYYTARRVKNAAISRSRRQVSINLIKLYFQERDPNIIPYLLVYEETPKPLKGTSDADKRKEGRALNVVSFPDGVVYFIFVVNSLLTGLLSYGGWNLLYVAGLISNADWESFAWLGAIIISLQCVIAAFTYQTTRYENGKTGHRAKNKTMFSVR